MREIYVVTGSAGNYECWDWSVAAYTDPAKAALHANKAQMYARDLLEKKSDWLQEHDYDSTGMPEELSKMLNPYDDRMPNYENRLSYCVTTVPVLEEVPA